MKGWERGGGAGVGAPTLRRPCRGARDCGTRVTPRGWTPSWLGRGDPKSTHKAAASQAVGGLRPTSGRAAAGRHPPIRPRRPPASTATSRPPAEPRAEAVTPQRSSSPRNKVLSATRPAASPRLLPDKKVIGRRPPRGPGVRRSAGLTKAAPGALAAEPRLGSLATTTATAALLSLSSSTTCPPSF